MFKSGAVAFDDAEATNDGMLVVKGCRKCSIPLLLMFALLGLIVLIGVVVVLLLLCFDETLAIKLFRSKSLEMALLLMLPLVLGMLC